MQLATLIKYLITYAMKRYFICHISPSSLKAWPSSTVYSSDIADNKAVGRRKDESCLLQARDI